MARVFENSIGATIKLADLEGDVHPLLHRLRAAEPVSWIPVLNAWLVTRYDDAIAVMRDAKTYTVDHPGFTTAQVVGPSMLSLDGAEHQRHRSPFERPFRRRAVETRFNPTVAAYSQGLIEGFARQGHAELRRDFAGPIAVKTMMVALGLTDIPISTVLGWYDTIVEAVTRVTAGEVVSAEGRAAFAALHNSLLPTLARDPEISLLAMARGAAQSRPENALSAGSLSEDEVIANAAVLLFGGIETTEGMIANALYHLLVNLEILQQVRLDPSVAPSVVEESLRLEPAATVVDRYAIHDVQLGAASIRAGDLVRVSLAGANRDPAIFDTPDRFDPQRKNLRTHVAFAQGPHVCLGLHLARLEAEQALKQMVTTLPNLRLIATAEAKQAAQPQGLVFRKPQALYVAWT